MPSDSSSGRPSLLRRFRNLWELSSGRPEPKPWSPTEAESDRVSREPGGPGAQATSGQEKEPIPWTPPMLESQPARHPPTGSSPIADAPGRTDASPSAEPRSEVLSRPSATSESASSRTGDTTVSVSRETADQDAQPEGATGAPPTTGQEPATETPHQALRSRIGELLELHPENAARLTRALLIEDEQAEEVEQSDAGRQDRTKVAILMIAMGQETTAGVMEYLSDLEIEQIAQAISALDVVTTEQEDQVLEEFEQLLMAGKYVSQGGIEFARGALEKALGPRKAGQLLGRVTSIQSSGFRLLRNVDPKHLAPFLAKEHPQTIALILSQLEPDQAAGVLADLPQDIQADVSFRIATMENIPPLVLRELEESLADDLHDLLAGQIAEIGGPQALAEILNQADRTTESAVLSRLDAQNAELAESVRNEMVRFDDIADLSDREIQMLLREVETKDLAIALMGASEVMKARILSNMSERVGGMIVEEMEQVGPLPKPEVEKIQATILRKVRELEEQGQITIVRGDQV